jgi:hypothetical protein
MRFEVLTTLLTRPITAVSLAFIVPLSVFGLVLSSNKSLADLLFVSIATGGVSGLTIGGTISSAFRCTFAWTLPGFRRGALLTFAASGAVAAASVGCLLVLFGKGAAAFLPALTTFAAFACGGALAIAPEGMWLQAFLWMGLVGLNVSGIAPRRWFAAAAEPAGTVLATGIAIGALGAAFGARAWRWAGLFPGDTRDTEPLGERLRRLTWWPRRRSRRPATFWRPVEPGSFTPTSTARCVLALRGERPSVTRAAGVVKVLVLMPVWFAFTHRGLNLSAAAAASMLLPAMGVLLLLNDRSNHRASYPWSRPLHRRAAYVEQVLLSAGFVVLGPTVLGIGLVLARAEAPSADAIARVLAASVIVLPIARLVHGVRPDRDGLDATESAMLFGMLLVMSGFWARAVERWLPVLAPSVVGQAAVMAILIAASQVLYWRHLGRHFSTRDLA